MESVQVIASDVYNCKSCDLFYSRKRAVSGQGNEGSSLMIVGEAPGRKEDSEGLPFVGKSGMLLDRTLKLVGLDRDATYITNAVKCKPPVGKVPSCQEIKKCSSFLDREIGAVKPSIIVPMGNSALRSLSEIFSTKLGKISEIKGKIIKLGNYLVIPQFHPAAILRNPKRLEMFKDNFVKIAKLYLELAGESVEELLSRYSVQEVPL